MGRKFSNKNTPVDIFGRQFENTGLSSLQKQKYRSCTIDFLRL